MVEISQTTEQVTEPIKVAYGDEFRPFISLEALPTEILDSSAVNVNVKCLRFYEEGEDNVVEVPIVLCGFTGYVRLQRRETDFHTIKMPAGEAKLVKVLRNNGMFTLETPLVVTISWFVGSGEEADVLAKNTKIYLLYEDENVTLGYEDGGIVVDTINHASAWKMNFGGLYENFVLPYNLEKIKQLRVRVDDTSGTQDQVLQG